MRVDITKKVVSEKTSSASLEAQKTVNLDMEKSGVALKNLLVQHGALLSEISVSLDESLPVPGKEDFCYKNSCANGSVCRELYNGYYCDCSGVDFTGTLCDEKVIAANCMLPKSEDNSKCVLCVDGYDLIDEQCQTCLPGHIKTIDLDEEICVPETEDCAAYFHKDSFFNEDTNACEITAMEVDFTFKSANPMACNSTEIAETNLDESSYLAELMMLESFYFVDVDDIGNRTYSLVPRDADWLDMSCSEDESHKVISVRLKLDGGLIGSEQLKAFARQIYDFSRHENATFYYGNYLVDSFRTNVANRSPCEDAESNPCHYGSCYNIGYDAYECDCSGTTWYGDTCEEKTVHFCDFPKSTCVWREDPLINSTFNEYYAEHAAMMVS